ncbi:unnamed protein product [Rotaria magnacalcarata]|uniref:Uncharacterized protein n=1 Tax=Rotaria magnacalcarata TaxID=392030 RepID=A0A816U1N7_9BILA|nr:unnamed protein product [Rotaria magnacalcarata]CAF2018761.1 unnamed protein product [Rotaria magnacalcarata]CAF2044194.1 unnamed protein product [Rotaria magnacalcarata]CAF2103587.1 unnamed protein product [Rotaria magnacalcarata]CAF3799417.1 unnamed protein product [Rotaria magnacalcarata]
MSCQREIARRYKVHHSTLCRTLKRRTSVIIRKRKKAPKMNSYDQEKRTQVNSGKLYRQILNVCDIIMDDEKYFGLSGDNVQSNQRYYTTNPLTTPTDCTLRYFCTQSFERKNVPIVHKLDNPPNVPQARPMETVWSLLEQKVYEHNWQAKSIDSLARRVRKKSKELEQIRCKL